MATVAIVFGLTYLDGFGQILAISLFSTFFFVVLSIAIYFLGLRAAHSPDKNSLTRLIMILVFLKMFGCLVIIIVYDQIWQPTSDFYILPFFLIYLTFTIFEVMTLTQISKMKL